VVVRKLRYVNTRGFVLLQPIATLRKQPAQSIDVAAHLRGLDGPEEEGDAVSPRLCSTRPSFRERPLSFMSPRLVRTHLCASPRSYSPCSYSPPPVRTHLPPFVLTPLVRTHLHTRLPVRVRASHPCCPRWGFSLSCGNIVSTGLAI